MGSFEGEIGNAAYERLKEDGPGTVRPSLYKRIESFSVDNMRALSTGASAGIVLLALVLTQDGGRTGEGLGRPPQDVEVGPMFTGSTVGQVRVPSLPEWQVIRRPVELIALQSPQFDRVQPQYGARRNTRNDREDSLSWQAPVPGGAEARVAVIRHGIPSAPPSLFVDMTRQQAERGVAVTRSSAIGALETKFGRIDVADMTFSDASGEAQACLAFRSAIAPDSPVVTGWVCAAKGAAVERPELGCFLDRLALLKSGEDQALRRFFTEAEQRRKPCPTTRVSTGRKPTWLDLDGRAPAIRSSDDVTGSTSRLKR